MAKGFIKRLDDLGRIVIPKEMLKNLGMKENNALEIIAVKEGLLLKPYEETESEELDAIAERLSRLGGSTTEWAVAEKIKELANELRKEQDDNADQNAETNCSRN